ncbi:hypothetical protein CI109_104864 [Kwoniella shandongensis]|uniref:Uncharacterized protein n=1 Tax=Kwoniella shandongensis TaxID=1734106 RepID=A0A5M6BTR3_9TREE|nr:uncharacterized protein CI109_006151 [Kwoniella shandongensis]KAA5525460.1 hypothetical protein CI109_006151 [Kwoniella shandongensis]
MPKEDTAHPPPLRRGDACLYCRKRRIRCSATKPTCQHCQKLGRECVYDNGKPVSRVKQLEDKVELLERLLSGGSAEGGAGESSTSTSVHPPPLIHHSSSGDTSVGSSGFPHHQQQHQNVEESSTSFEYTGSESIDINMLDALTDSSDSYNPNMFPSFGSSLFGGMNVGGTIPNVGTDDGQQAESLFDFSTLDPTFMSLVNSMQAASTGPTPQNSVPLPQAQPHLKVPSAFTFSRSHQTASPTTSQTSGLSSSDSNTKYAQPSVGATSVESSSVPSPDTRPLYHAYVTSIEDTPITFGTGIPIPQDKDYKTLIEAASVQYPADAGPMPPHFTPECDTRPMTGIATFPKTSPKVNRDPEEDDRQWVIGVTDSSPSEQPASDPKSFDLPKGERDASALVGGWFDAADLPKIARDHLLDLFFSGMRLFGQEFHVPRFMASLTLPPSKRPHPCLLYSMYTMASRISSSPAISQLELHFYSIAGRQLDEAINNADRLLDACRASTILAVYKYSKARYHEGWMMTGQAARLALSCGLHQISSSVFKPVTPSPHADLVGMMRHRSYVIPPAKDAIEHAERIWAFWSIYITDRAGAIATQWPPGISDDVIMTPFPRPLYEYELGFVREEDDTFLNWTFDPPPNRQPLAHFTASSMYNIRIRAMAILEKASKLMYLDPEEGWEKSCSISSSVSPSGGIDDYLFSQAFVASAFDSPTGGINGFDRSRRDSADALDRTWTKCAKIRTPKAYEAVKSALLRVEEDLPLQWRTDWLVWDGKLQDWHFTGGRQDNITLHFVLGCAWMFMEDVFAFNAENTISVNIARRLTATVRYVSSEVTTSDLDVFIAMTWSFASKILIREMKRLHSIGDIIGAADIEVDIEVIVQALRAFGQRYAVGSLQATRADRYRQATTDEYNQMGKDQEEAI